MRYKIQFLDNDSFNNLPYKDVETSLGLADSRTQTAYVRRTGINAVDMFTAAHELEHLEEGHAGEYASHNKYGDGVYYKDIMEIFSPKPEPQQQSPMQQFQPQAQEAPSIQSTSSPSAAPQTVQPGQGNSGAPAAGGPGEGAIQKIRGFFAGRSPQGGM